MTLVAGCYERFLFGFTYDTDTTEVILIEPVYLGAISHHLPSSSPLPPPQVPLVRTFTHAAHKGSVKSLAAAGSYVASGGSDDLIHVFNLREDKDLGFLMNPGQGAISCLQFFTPEDAYEPANLLTGCSDGSISVWKAGGGWDCMKTLRGHKKEVTSITVHPSGCLALTTSRDGTLKLWDLVKGRVTFSTKIDGGGVNGGGSGSVGVEADAVAFSPSGKRYAVQVGTHVIIKPVSSSTASSQTEGEGEVVKLAHPRRVLSMLWGPNDLTDRVVITGTEDGTLRVWNALQGTEMLCIPKAHATRVKALACPYVQVTEEGDGGGVPVLLASASSDGGIKVWRLREAVDSVASSSKKEVDAVCVGSVETKARITTLCAVDPVGVMEGRIAEAKKVRKKKKKVQKEAEEEEGGVKDENAITTTLKTKKQRIEEPSRLGKKQQTELREKVGKKEQKEGVVSFLDEGWRKKEMTRKKKVQINAKRAAENRSTRQRQHKR